MCKKNIFKLKYNRDGNKTSLAKITLKINR